MLDAEDLLLRSQLVGCGRAQASGYRHLDVNLPAGTVARLVTSLQFARGRRPRRSPTRMPDTPPPVG